MADNVAIFGQGSETATGDSGKYLLEAIKAISNALKVVDYAYKSGEDPVAWRTWGGASADPYVVTADGQVITGECWVLAVRTNITGTSSTLALYDGTSTSGTPIFEGVPTATINVAGYMTSIAGDGVAVHCTTGLYADVGGTGSPEFVVFAIPSQP